MLDLDCAKGNTHHFLNIVSELVLIGVNRFSENLLIRESINKRSSQYILCLTLTGGTSAGIESVLPQSKTACLLRPQEGAP